MSTSQAIIRRAMRLMGVLSGGDQPTGDDAADGLEMLQSTVLDLPGLLLNGHWRERAISTAWTAIEYDRLTVTAPGVVTLPSVVSGTGCTEDPFVYGPCTRPPHDLAKVQILGKAANLGLWVYSATKSAWGRLDALTISSELPFGSEDDAGLAAQLAVNWAEEFGASAAAGPRTVALAQQSARSFRARFKKYDHRAVFHGVRYGDEVICGDPDITDVSGLFSSQLAFPI